MSTKNQLKLNETVNIQILCLSQTHTHTLLSQSRHLQIIYLLSNRNIPDEESTLYFDFDDIVKMNDCIFWQRKRKSNQIKQNYGMRGLRCTKRDCECDYRRRLNNYITISSIFFHLSFHSICENNTKFWWKRTFVTIINSTE